MVWLNALTEFGDIAILMPLAAVMLLWLMLVCARRDAVWWAVAVAFCLGSTALFKICFYGCPPAPDLHSPSGHTSLGTLVYGAMALVTAAEGRGWARILVIAGGAGFILAIAASRLLLHAHSPLLHAHSPPEVGLGLIIGTAALALFGRQYRWYRTSEISLFPLLVTGGLLMVILHGRELGAEEFLRGIAGYFQIHCA